MKYLSSFLPTLSSFLKGLMVNRLKKYDHLKNPILIDLNTLRKEVYLSKSFNSKVEEEKRNFIIALESIIEKHDIECQQ